ncbi:phosphatase PAP2 family protein [Streptomyces phytohabitans]|uniref:phosphatase PAP2 family protein n=1 Tax=Streptomyces phytohabitans TaxID=1150371 RepID=UPI00345C1896
MASPRRATPPSPPIPSPSPSPPSAASRHCPARRAPGPEPVAATVGHHRAPAAPPRRPSHAAHWCLLTTGLGVLLTVVVLATGGGQLPLDAGLHRLAVEHRPGALATTLRGVTETATGLAPYVVALAAGAYAAPALDAGTRRRTLQVALWAALFAQWLALGRALRIGLMTAVDRPRPPAEDWLAHASRWAFPSGHTTTATITAGLVVLALLARRPPAYRLWAALAVAWAVAVGVSRVGLGVHWTSDVVAAWCYASAWTLLAALIATRTAAVPTRTRTGPRTPSPP